MGIIPEAPLGSSNATIPGIGFGTASWPLGGSETMKQSVLQAMELGYRHFDSAAIYQSKQCLGEAIAQALHLGLVKSRKDLFITSKHWCSDGHPNRVLPVLQNTLRR